MSMISNKKNAQYEWMVKDVHPKAPILKNCIWAFFVGGIICTIGEYLLKLYEKMGHDPDDSAMLTSITLIFIAAILTGLDIYDSIGKYAGAGSIVPITGFSNSIVSPAMEFKKEGFIFGMAAKMFLIAGPVIVYGVIASVVVGLIYYFI